MLFIIVSILCGLVTAFVVYCRWQRGTLERLGIPVVKSHFLFGSQHDFAKIVGHYRDVEWFNTHGRIYGVYAGRKPQIHILDHEMIRNIFIKDFDKFTNRGMTMDFGSELINEMLDFLNDEKWKTVRSALTPIFTTAKLKRLSPRMTESVDDFIALLKKDVQASENGHLDAAMYQEVFAICMDIIARCTLNIQVKDPRSPANDFMMALQEFFPTETPAYVSFALNNFPFLIKFLGLIQGKAPEGFYARIFRQVMDQRKASGEKNDDFIDLLIDMMEKTKGAEYQKLKISETTVLSQAIEFYIAGMEGMTTAVTAVIMYSAQNPQISEKIYEEIDSYLLRNNNKGQDELSHDTLSELKYLNACLTEALRLHPSFTRTDRICSEEVEYKGLRIPKGMIVTLPSFPYNRDPEYFPNPDSFDPERFLSPNKESMDMYAFSTFGFGPRMCIGMRFAFEAMLVMGVKLFQNFKFSVKPEQTIEYYPTAFPGFSSVKPLNVGITLRTEKTEG